MKIDNFTDWFRNSVVVDSMGNPLTMYHGTGTRFSEFRVPAFFTSEIEVAEEYADLRAGSDRRIEKVFLSIQNPAFEAQIRSAAVIVGLNDVMTFALIDPSQNNGVPRAVIAELRSQGYDGAILEDFDFSGNPFTEYVVFEQGQIKRVSDDICNQLRSTSGIRKNKI